MAAETFIFSPNTFAGSLAAGYQALALLDADSVKRNLLTVIPNVKKRKVIRGVDDTVEFQEPSCTFVGQSSSITLDETYLDPVKYEVMKEFCWADLLATWESETMTAGSLNDGDEPVELASFLREYMLRKVAIGNEQLYWLGKAKVTGVDISFSSAYTGLLPKMLANGSTFKVSGNVGQLAITGITNAGVVTVASTTTLSTGDKVTIANSDGNQQYAGASISGQTFTITVINATTFSLGVALTGSTAATSGWARFINANNVTTVLSSVYMQVPEDLKNNPNLIWYIPRHVANAYRVSQSTGTNAVGAFLGDRTLDFLGVKLEPINYFSDNTIVVALKSNIFLAVDLVSDETEIREVDMRMTTNDDKIRWKMSMKSDVNCKYFSEVLMYTPLYA